MLHPALAVAGADGDLVLAAADDHSPTAAEDRGDTIVLFFRDPAARDAAHHALAAAFPAATLTPHDVDDENWAARSQPLQPVTVGSLTILPAATTQHPGEISQHPTEIPQHPAATTQHPAEIPRFVVVPPSTGFGTGHHATTRLCLRALQREALAGRSVLDVGTGSGILAIAAVRLGAAAALGIDDDPDAIRAARENLMLNPGTTNVTFALASLAAFQAGAGGGRADIVVANLTGALLAREAGRLLSLVHPGGSLILSGFLAAERDDVAAAFAAAGIAGEEREDDWVALTLRPNVSAEVPV